MKKLKKRLTLLTLLILAIMIVICCGLTFMAIGRLVKNNAKKINRRRSYSSKLEILPSSLHSSSVKIDNLVQKPSESIKRVNKESDEFVLNIPKIDLIKNVASNVDPTDEIQYMTIIDSHIAHGKWTLTPSELKINGTGISYLFAHRDGAHGFLHNLDKLNANDNIFVHYHGEVYYFKVISKYVVGSESTEIYTSASEIPLLRIQTCENGTKDRLIVDAKLLKIT